MVEIREIMPKNMAEMGEGAGKIWPLKEDTQD